MIIHILIDIAQKHRTQDRHRAKRNAHQVHVAIALRVGNLARGHNRLVGHLRPSGTLGDGGDQFDLFQERRTRKSDRLLDGDRVRDFQFQLHRAADVVDDVGDELVVKDVVVDRVTDRPADDTDRERECRDRGDEVVGADNCSDNAGGDDDAPYAQPGEDQQAPGAVQGVCVEGSEGAASGSHDTRGDDHKFAVVAAEDGEEPEDDEGAGEDRKANRKTA